MKERLDVLLVQRGLAPSREKAKAMIMEGNVYVNKKDKFVTNFIFSASSFADCSSKSNTSFKNK